jgi:hypothetical protein
VRQLDQRDEASLATRVPEAGQTNVNGVEDGACGRRTLSPHPSVGRLSPPVDEPQNLELAPVQVFSADRPVPLYQVHKVARPLRIRHSNFSLPQHTTIAVLPLCEARDDGLLDSVVPLHEASDGDLLDAVAEIELDPLLPLGEDHRCFQVGLVHQTYVACVHIKFPRRLGTAYEPTEAERV